MGSATRIVRMALHAFFSHYHPAASAAALLALPFSAAVLVSRSPALLQLAAPPRAILLLQPALSRRLRRVFVAAGFPPASQLLFLLNHRLSQSIVSFLATLPLAMSFLLLAKAYAVHAVVAARGRGRGGASAARRRRWRRWCARATRLWHGRSWPASGAPVRACGGVRGAVGGVQRGGGAAPGLRRPRRARAVRGGRDRLLRGARQRRRRVQPRHGGRRGGGRRGGARAVLRAVLPSAATPPPPSPWRSRRRSPRPPSRASSSSGSPGRTPSPAS